MNKKFTISISLLSFLFSCSNDDPIQTEQNNYQLKIPAHFPQNYNMPNSSSISAEVVELGRQLFYDPILSLDKSISCGTCHIQEFGFADKPSNKFSLGVNNKLGDKNTMALSNLIWQTHFFWDGRASSLEEQALGPIANPVEMNLPIDSAIARLNQSNEYSAYFKKVFNTETIEENHLATAIAQFERTLISGNSKFDLYKLGKVDLTDAEKRGENLFFTHPEYDIENGVFIRGANCGDCHSGFLTQSNNFSNNGLDSIPKNGFFAVSNDKNDLGKFKIPNLRNIEVTAPYMHDGRFKTLEEVLNHYSDHIKNSPTLDPQITNATNDGSRNLSLTKQEKEDIIAFLLTLTDQDFLDNSDFADPQN